MGRKRTISQEQILDAAQRVVGRDGAGQLTVDAVASEAGISKASVLNFFTSKRALIEAVVERLIRQDAELNEEAILRFSGQDASVVRGRVAAAASWIPRKTHATAINLCAAAAQDPQLRRGAQKFQRSVIARIPKTSAHPRGAMLAHLALEGLKLLELLDFFQWPAAERKQLLRDIEWLVTVDPKPETALIPQSSPPTIASAKKSVVQKQSSKSGSQSSQSTSRRKHA